MQYFLGSAAVLGTHAYTLEYVELPKSVQSFRLFAKPCKSQSAVLWAYFRVEPFAALLKITIFQYKEFGDVIITW